MEADLAVYQVVQRSASKPFAWGSEDCVMLAFDVIQKITGKDPGPDLRGTYENALGAAKILRDCGGLERLCDARLGKRVSAETIETGDIALIEDALCSGVGSRLGALAVCWRGMLIARANDGLVYLPTAKAKTAWRAL